MGNDRDVEQALARINTSVPHPARVYDYLLGGKDNYEADRAVAEQVLAQTTGLVEGVKENRAFLGRAVRHLAEQGVTQFLDLGTGIPTQGNTHEVAQAVNPNARVVYVDNDPIVMNHARALLRGTPEGRTAYIEADMLEPESVLKHPRTLETLDFSQPVAVIVIGVLMYFTDEQDPWGVVKQYSDATCRGSHLALTHTTADFQPEILGAFEESYQSPGAIKLTNRSGPEIARFFEGYALVEPGLITTFAWRPEEPAPSGTISGAYAAIGRKL
ncbi:SAM-dependent methyltransferase [Nonomuraea antri]|uniref:SAM-dependent methyltransferase n=1 Tax=Nonomuraea antri TaxID=2730852 RepID=UPI002E288568|nr:SAM-dependent methyltransferase [Nonomuraea antri]